MMISFIKGKKLSKATLNHERTVINHIILESWDKFH